MTKSTTTSKIELLIVDDHPLFRRGLKNAFSETTDIHVIDEAEDGNTAMSRIRELQPDVVLLDIALPGKSGLDVLKQIKSEFQKLPVLILSVYPEDQYAVRLFKAGASGYLCKDSDIDLMLEAVRKVAQGGVFATQKTLEKLAFNFMNTDKLPHELLSDREYQVFLLIASGNSLTEIGEQLSLSVKTISTHRTRILDKMRLKKNAELIHYAIEYKLL